MKLGPGAAWSCQTHVDGLFFLLVSSGNGSYRNGSPAVQLDSRSVLVLRQNLANGRFLAGKSGIAFRCFSLKTEQLFPLCDAAQLSRLDGVLERLETPKVYPSSSQEAKACHELLASMPAEASLVQRAQVLAIVARVLSQEFEATRIRPGFLRPDEHMEQVFEKLSEEEFLALSITELAARFGCSRRHLARLFRQYFGTSIADFRMELRLMKVASLLRNPNAKIVQVAEQCGFNQLNHFNACFKRRFGISPGRWRKHNPAPNRVGRAGAGWCQAAEQSAQPVRAWPPVSPFQTKSTPDQVFPEQVIVNNPLNLESAGSLQLIETVGS